MQAFGNALEILQTLLVHKKGLLHTHGEAKEYQLILLKIGSSQQHAHCVSAEDG